MKIKTIVLVASGMVGVPPGEGAVPKECLHIRENGLAMIQAVTVGYPKKILEVPDIIQLAGSESGGSVTTPHHRIPGR